MAKKLMVRYDCSRCERCWYVPHTEGVETAEPPRLEVTFMKDGTIKNVSYSELCESCTSAVEGYLKSIAKEREPRAKEKADEDPLPLE